MDELIRKLDNVKSSILLDFESHSKATFFLNTNQFDDIIDLNSIKESEIELLRNSYCKFITYSHKIEKLFLLKKYLSSIEHWVIRKNFDICDSFILQNNNNDTWNFVRILSYTESFIQRKEHKKIMRQLLGKYNIARLKKDIEYLKKHAILTSRLGIMMYKITKWDFNISDTKIGKYYAEKTKRKSKIYNNKEFEIKNTKGYFIKQMTNYERDLERFRIAKELVYNRTCSLVLIEEITKIPIDVLEIIKVQQMS